MAEDSEVVVDDLLLDIVRQSIEHEQLAAKEFQPWHRPRKQWVRVKQWKREIQRLVDALNLTDRPLTYLSLPGDDLLDVRVVCEVCEHKKIKLRFLGFNSPLSKDASANAERSLSIAEIVSLPFVDDNSLVICDRLESIANVRSVGFKWVREYGTFDVINFDLCDSISAPSRRRSGNPTYYDVIDTLFANQVRNRTAPWLFFLTTRCGSSDVHIEDIAKLYECVENNVAQSAEFRLLLSNLFNIEDFDEESLKIIQARIDFPVFMQMFCIGFGKWLLQKMIACIPPSKITMLTSYQYKIKEPGDIISVAYRFDPMPQFPVDSVGLANVASIPTPVFQEAELALKIVESTKNMIDIDSILASSPSEMENMVSSTESMLQNARYPVQTYRNWLAGETKH